MKIKVISNAFVALALVVSNAALAYEDQPCQDDIISIINADLNPTAKTTDDYDYDFVSEACKIAPYDNGVEITAVAAGAISGEYSNDGFNTKKFLVSTIDVAKGKIIAKYSADVEEDALTQYGEGSLAIDTARYQLSDSVRAFGVKFASMARGPSCAENGSYDELTLFVPRGKELLPVLKLYTQTVTALRGCVGKPTEHNLLLNASIKISVEKTKTNGLSDLRLTATIDKDTTEGQGRPRKHVETAVLHYDGKAYDVSSSGKWWVQGAM